jgi:hypothetical protein
MEKFRETRSGIELTPDEIDGVSVAVSLATLHARGIDFLRIAGTELVAVGNVARDEDNTMREIGYEEDGTPHLFVYEPLQRSGVLHVPDPEVTDELESRFIDEHEL